MGIIDRILAKLYASVLKKTPGFSEIEKQIQDMHNELSDDDKKKMLAASDSAETLMKESDEDYMKRLTKNK